MAYVILSASPVSRNVRPLSFLRNILGTTHFLHSRPLLRSHQIQAETVRKGLNPASGALGLPTANVSRKASAALFEAQVKLLADEAVTVRKAVQMIEKTKNLSVVDVIVEVGEAGEGGLEAAKTVTKINNIPLDRFLRMDEAAWARVKAAVEIAPEVTPDSSLFKLLDDAREAGTISAEKMLELRKTASALAASQEAARLAEMTSTAKTWAKLSRGLSQGANSAKNALKIRVANGVVRFNQTLTKAQLRLMAARNAVREKILLKLGDLFPEHIDNINEIVENIR